jgi:hypothetical protein
VKQEWTDEVIQDSEEHFRISCFYSWSGNNRLQTKLRNVRDTWWNIQFINNFKQIEFNGCNGHFKVQQNCVTTIRRRSGRNGFEKVKMSRNIKPENGTGLNSWKYIINNNLSGIYTNVTINSFQDITQNPL